MTDQHRRSQSPRSGAAQPRSGAAQRRSGAAQPGVGRSRAAQSPAGRSRAKPTRADPARRVAYDVLRAVADRDAYANLLLPALLTERGLTGRDAAFATELTYGTLRGRGSYDAILAACSDRDELDPPVRDVLRLGAHQLLATRVGCHAAVATSVDLAKDVCGPRPSGFVNAVLRRVATRDLDAWIQIVAPDRSQDPSGYLAVRYSYPRWIVDVIRDALGEVASAGTEAASAGTEAASAGTEAASAGTETEDALAAGNVRPGVVLALYPAPASGTVAAPGPGTDAAPAPAADADSAPDPAGLLPDGERTRWSPYGFRLAGGDPAPLVASGRAAVQDEASQLAALALTRAALSGDQDQLWLDLCAGPGGKTRLLSGLAAARGARLVASDIHLHRAKRVLAALHQAGQDGTGQDGAAQDGAAQDVPRRDNAVIVANGRRVPWPSGTFDRVLADVPCSGLGSLRRRPEARWRKTPADVEELTILQRQLLNAALNSVRPGGVVAYVTCSPHPAETSQVVAAVAQGRDDVIILDAPAVLPEVPALRGPEPADPRFAQFWPQRHGTDAIFLALLQLG